MRDLTVDRFFAVLALLLAATTVVVAAALVVRRTRPEGAVARRLDDVSDAALWLAWAVAAVTSSGSLYYSLVRHYDPCELCWYQRICMYPLAVILFVAARRRTPAIRRYVWPQIAVGAVIAAYQTQLQAFPSQQSFCPAANPCTLRYVWQFGFVSLPLMDLVALTFIAVMLVLARPAATSDELGRP